MKMKSSNGGTRQRSFGKVSGKEEARLILMQSQSSGQQSWAQLLLSWINLALFPPVQFVSW